MEQRRANVRLIAIAAIGILGCAAAIGVRMTLRKTSIDGLWRGYSYHDMDGKLVPDKAFGEYRITINKDGTYEENGNSTSGKWVRKGDEITLTPIKFYEKTPDEHRAKYWKNNRKASVTIERLLAMKMKPMKVTYSRSSDTLLFSEHSIHYKYDRMP